MDSDSDEPDSARPDRLTKRSDAMRLKTESYVHSLAFIATRDTFLCLDKPISQLAINLLRNTCRTFFPSLPITDFLWILQLDSVLIFQRLSTRDLAHFMKLALERDRTQFDFTGAGLWNRARRKWLEKRFQKFQKRNPHLTRPQIASEEFFRNCTAAWNSMEPSKRFGLLCAELPEDFHNKFWMERKTVRIPKTTKVVKVFKTQPGEYSGIKPATYCRDSSTQTQAVIPKECTENATQTQPRVASVAVQTNLSLLCTKKQGMTSFPRAIHPWFFFQHVERRRMRWAEVPGSEQFRKGYVELRERYLTLGLEEKQKYSVLSEGSKYRRFKALLENKAVKQLEKERKVVQSLFFCYFYENHDRLQEKHPDLGYIDLVRKAYKKFRKLDGEKLRNCERAQEKLTELVDKVVEEGKMEEKLLKKGSRVEAFRLKVMRAAADKPHKRQAATDIHLPSETCKRREIAKTVNENGDPKAKKPSERLPACLARLLPPIDVCFVYVNECRRNGIRKSRRELFQDYVKLSLAERRPYKQELRGIRMDFAKACRDYLARVENEEERKELEKYLQSLKYSRYLPYLLDELVESSGDEEQSLGCENVSESDS